MSSSQSPIVRREQPRIATSSFVTFLIGKDEEKFVVHKDFVCYSSPALNAAFNNDRFEETNNLTYKIVDASLEAFEYFAQFIYSQRVEVPSDVQASNGTDNFATLAELWILGDRFLMPKLQNQAIKAIWELSDITATVPTNIFHYVYENTVFGSQLRHLMISFCVLDLTVQEIGDEVDDFPKELLLDTLQVDITLMCPDRCIDYQFERHISDFEVPE